MGERSRRYARRPKVFALVLIAVAGVAGLVVWITAGLARAGATLL